MGHDDDCARNRTRTIGRNRGPSRNRRAICFGARTMRTKSGTEFESSIYEDRYFEGVKTLWREAPLDLRDWRAPEIRHSGEDRDAAGAFPRRRSRRSGHRHDDGGIRRPSRDGSMRSPSCSSVGETASARRCSARPKNACSHWAAPRSICRLFPANFSVVAFYEKLGYAIEERVSMSKPIGRFAKGGSS